jgi:Protein of unknown function (DUF2939)
MRRSIWIVLGLVLALYAWPMASALELRLALRSGNAARLEPCVDWTTLRQNLKATVRGNLTAEPSKSWFRRNVTERVVPALADRAIDTAVAPSRLAWFLKRRMQLVGESGQPAQPPSTTSDGADDEIDKMTSPRRLRWAFFESLSRFRIEVADPRMPERRLVAIFEPQGLRWRLTNAFYDTKP